MNELNIGDKVYIPSYQYTEYTEICTVCYWKKKVRVILWDDEIVETDCNACNDSYWPPRWFINVRWYKDNIQLVTITWKEITENSEWKSIEYRYNDNYITKEWWFFETKELAEIKLKEIIEENITYNKSNFNQFRNNKIMSLSWSIRYHTKEADECKKNMNRHLDKVKYIKTISK